MKKYTFEEAKQDFKEIAIGLIQLKCITTNRELSSLACGFNSVLIRTVNYTFEQIKEMYSIVDKLTNEYNLK